MPSDPDFQPQQRLHGLSWLFALLTFIRQFIVPVVAFILFGARDDTMLWSGIFIVPLLLAAMWQQHLYRYGFGPRGLVIREGLLFRNVRQIEYQRIENIDTERGLLHRLLGVAQVRVETSTGGKPEALIRVLGLDAVQEMRERVFSDARRATPEAVVQEQEETLLHLPPGELIRYGLIDNRGMIIVAAVIGVLYQSGFANVVHDTVEAWFGSSSVSEFAALGVATQVLLGFGALIGALLAVRMLSVLLALVTLFDFRLTRHAAGLRVRHGLITRLAFTLRLPRIQAVHQTESILHRVFRRVSLAADLAGDGGGQSGQGGESRNRVRWLAPLCTRERVPQLIAAALPFTSNMDERLDWRPLAAGARRRIFRRGLFIWVIVAVAPAVWFLNYGASLVLIAGVPLAWWRATVYVRNTRWALTPEAVLFRSGWLTRRLVIAPRSRVQAVVVSASPFDRRQRMAAVSVDTAGASSLSGPIRIPYLESDTAWRLAMALYRCTSDSSLTHG